MKFKNGVIIDEEGNLHIIKPKYKLFSFDFPTISPMPEIILTEEEAKERGLEKRIGWKRKFLGKDKYYTKIDGERVLITIKEKKKELH